MGARLHIQIASLDKCSQLSVYCNEGQVASWALTDGNAFDFRVRELDRLIIQREHAMEGLQEHFGLVVNSVSSNQLSACGKK